MNDDTRPLVAGDMTGQQDLPAGPFSSWLRRTRKALIHENGADVPCGECKACCTSSYFIHIMPEEARTLSRIDKKLLFAAPGMPKGNVLLGFDEYGRCPMLIDGRCSIYEVRPLSCRNYDCRIFSAAGIAAGDADKLLITRRVRRWKFSYPTRRDRDLHAAVQTAARFIQERAECFPAGAAPDNASQLAVLAIKVYDAFLRRKRASAETGSPDTDLEKVEAVREAYRKFEAGRMRDK
jgi:Fe-S-cluster containining protein